MQALALLAAAATWSAPQTVSAPHTFAAPLFASADQKGNVLAAWGWQDGIGQTAPTGASHVRVAAGAVSPEERAPAGLVAAQAYGDGRWVELADKQVDARGQRFRLTIKDGATTTRLATAFILFRPQLSVAPDGSAIVAWVESHGTRHVVRVAMRSGSGAFSKAATLVADGQTTLVSTAISKRGDALVAFVRNRRVLVRVRRPGESWDPPVLMSSARARTTWQLTAAFDDTARAVLVWRRHRFSSAGHPGVTALSSATLAPAAARWSAAQSIEADGARDPALSPALPSGLVLGYINGPNSHATARVRESDAGGRFGPPQDAAAPQGGVRSLSVVYDGAAGLVVGWVIPNPSGDGGGIGYAATVPPGGSLFGPREQVTPNEATFDMRLVRSAGQIRGFWTARPEGTGPSVPLSKIHTLVRTAVRSE
jgi:hypothetical protein